MQVVGIIASRYGSTRLPAKALADICGKPMLWWVYQQAIQAKNLDKVLVATDDARITSVCEKYSIPTIMTKSIHSEAANRLQEVSQKVDAQYYVQINGDEPLIKPELISMVIPKYIPVNEEMGTNIITKMTNPVEVIDKSNIKVVFDEQMRCTYMSRTPIPCPYKTIEFDYYKHVGIIGYTKKMLEFYAQNPAGKFEQIEGIATLRFIDYGKPLHLIIAENVGSLSVDTAMDLDRVRIIIKEKIKNNEFSPYLLDKLAM